jgi:predicted GIY-YIG superfamily endonuclease
MWYCYILRNTQDEYKNLTYNGSTNDPWRRLRQHNREIVGGAKATKKGHWEIYVLLQGFSTHNNALSCEWRIKHPTGKRQRPKKYCGVGGRVSSLNEVLVLDKWTSKCDVTNSNCSYILYLTEDVKEHICIDAIPKNITIKIVENITRESILEDDNIKEKI